MDHTKGSKGSRRQWSGSKHGNEHKGLKNSLTQEEVDVQKAIRTFKLNTPECPKCKQPIIELSSALADKDTGNPIHFDCALNTILENEHLLPNQKVTYIGQGRFAVISFPNIHDMRNFKIERVIEWEAKDKKYEWRSEISGLYSQIH